MERLQEKDPVGWKERVLDMEPSQIDWWVLNELQDEGEEVLALEMWARCRLAALEELRSGHRAAQAVEPKGASGSCLERSRFLAIRAELRLEWKPKRGMESLLVDQLAQVQMLLERALELYVHRTTYRGFGTTDEEKRKLKDYGSWLTPRVTEFEAEEASFQSYDRLQRMFLRTVRALRDLRRMSPPVVVQNAGQVNVGQQQVNVNGTSS